MELQQSPLFPVPAGQLRELLLWEPGDTRVTRCLGRATLGCKEVCAGQGGRTEYTQTFILRGTRPLGGQWRPSCFEADQLVDVWSDEVTGPSPFVLWLEI